MPIDEPPEAENKPKQHYTLVFAWRISNGETGNEYVYFIEEDKFFIYENGIWLHLHSVEILDQIRKSPLKNELCRYSPTVLKQIVENLKSIKYKRLKDFNCVQGLNLLNGVINPRDSKIRAHSKEDYSTIQLDYEYNPMATCQLWGKTLEEIFEGDQRKIELLQEFFGYCLIPDVKQKKALLLLGDSDCGKSTILNVLRRLIGKQNCSSVPLKYLSNPQYTPLLVNKLVNIDADVDKNASNYEAEFKIITSGEPINCNQKHVPTFEFIPICRIVLAANTFPKITDHSSAFYKRLILIPCNRIFEDKEQDKNLSEKLYSELPGILNWALKGKKRLSERGTFIQHDFMKSAVRELEDDNNPSNLFIDEYVEVHHGNILEKGELYKKYEQWCDTTNIYKLSLVKFSQCIYKRFHTYTQKDARGSEGNRPRIWQNIRYIDHKFSDNRNVGFKD